MPRRRGSGRPGRDDGGVVYVDGAVAHVINKCGPAIKGAREFFTITLNGGGDCNDVMVKVRNNGDESSLRRNKGFIFSLPKDLLVAGTLETSAEVPDECVSV